MRPISKTIYNLAGLVFFLSIFILCINQLIFKYPGNQFYPQDALLASLLLIVFCLGLIIAFGVHSKCSYFGIELLKFYSLMALIAIATNAIQLSPFLPVDLHIIQFESLFDIQMPLILEWTNQHPIWNKLFSTAYDTLPYQMSLLPLWVIINGRFNLMDEFYFLMLFTTLLGFSVYYFFPTTAPASMISSPYFKPEQLATGIKFYQIHHQIIPTTNAGGLIALPSFHVIWALICTYLIREWTFAWVILTGINALLISACVLLGWHYLTDVVASFILVGLSYYCLKKYVTPR